MPPFTASELIAITAVVVGPIVGLLTGLKLHAAQATSEAERARTARVHANRATTYVDVLEHVYRTGDLVERTEPSGLVFEGEPGPPAFPSDDELRRLTARIGAFGSREVRDDLIALRKSAIHFNSAAFLLRARRDGIHRGTSGEEVKAAFEKVEATRKDVRAAVERAVDRVNAELAE